MGIKMNYKEAMVYISSTSQYGSVLGLDTIRELLKRLGNPEKKVRMIHIGGTNGKGSTAAFISSILAEAGYRVGRYLSPVIFEYRERIQIQTEEGSFYITEEEVGHKMQKVKEAAEAMTAGGFPHPTSFELETAMAFLVFAESCDVAVVEVGLGGRLDATNVIEESELSVLTAVSLDHMQILGDSLEAIACEKAGIIKKGGRVVSYDRRGKEEIAADIIKKVCEEQEAMLVTADFKEIKVLNYTLEGTAFEYKGRKEMVIRLLGECQVKNAVTALEAVWLLQDRGFSIGEKEIRKGLLETCWPGRFEIISRNPFIIVDGAHNEEAAVTLANSIERYLSNRKITYIMGVLEDKDYRAVLRHTLPYAYRVLTITPDNARALPSLDLKLAAKETAVLLNLEIEEIAEEATVKGALEKAMEVMEKDGVILAFGSLSFLNEVYHFRQ